MEGLFTGAIFGSAITILVITYVKVCNLEKKIEP